MAFSSLDVISGPDAGPLVLGVACPRDRPGDAGLTEFARLLGGGRRSLRLMPAPVPGWPLAGAGHADLWLENIRQDPRPVAAVLGHRVGAVYAAEIAETVARWQHPPTLILFDPEVASASLLARTLDAELASDSSLFSAAEFDRARTIAAEVSGRAADGASIAGEIVAAYRDILSVPWERAGLGDVRDSEFTRSFETCVTWLAAAAQLDPSRAWRHSTAIVSNEYPVSSGAAEDVRGLVGRQLAFDVSRAGLLSFPAVADAVLGLLEESRANVG